MLFVTVNTVGEDQSRIGTRGRWPGEVGWHVDGFIAWVTHLVGCDLRRVENSAGRNYLRDQLSSQVWRRELLAITAVRAPYGLGLANWCASLPDAFDKSTVNLGAVSVGAGLKPAPTLGLPRIS